MAAKPTTTASVPATKSLPPIGVLFSDSWELFKLSWKKLLLFSLVMAGIVVVFVIVIGIILAVSVGGGIYAFSHGGFSPAAIGSLGIGIFVAVLLLVAAAIVLGSLSQAGWILSVNEPKLTIEQILRRSFHFVLPLFALSFLTFLLALPAFFLFLIPGLFVVFFLYFGPYAMILGNRGPLDALRRSIYLIKTNFGAMFLRALLMIGLYLVVSIALSLTTGFTTVKVPLLGILLAIFRNVVNIALAWFLISYSLTLYKQAEAASADREGKGKLLWFVLLAVVSLVFVVLVIGTIAKSVLSNPQIKDAIMSGAKSSNSQSLGNGDVLKQTYRTAFISSCEQGSNTNTKLCTCVADNLVNKYTTAQLQDIIKKYADTKVVPQELTDATKSCVPAVTQ